MVPHTPILFSIVKNSIEAEIICVVKHKIKINTNFENELKKTKKKSGQQIV